jgi:hypothetical protein
MTLTQSELGAIRKRAEAASSGPWEWDEKGDCIDAPGFEVCVDLMGYDAEFIANARQDVPALLAEVERLQAENTSLCPIGDLDVITSLKLEKQMMVEQIADLRAELKARDAHDLSEAAEETRKLRQELERQRRERDFDWDIGY